MAHSRIWWEQILKPIDRRLIHDGALIALISALLGAIHLFLPPDAKTLLVFNHEAFRSWSLLTSAYVHATDLHLLNNLSGFLIAAIAVYGVCWSLGERDWFRITVIVFLIALPIAVNLTSYQVLGVLAPEASPTGRGFSGVGAGMVGFLFATLFVLIQTISSRMIAIYIAETISLILALEVFLIYGGLDLRVFGIAGVAFVLVGWGISREAVVPRWSELNENIIEIYIGIGIVVLLVTFIYVLFPADFIGDSMTINIIAHGAGFLFGTFGALIIRLGLNKQV